MVVYGEGGILGMTTTSIGFPCSSAGKESAYNAGDPSSIPGLGRPQEKGMATHSSILAWKNPEEPGRLYPWDCKELDTTERLSTAQHYQNAVSLGEDEMS